MLEIFVAEFFYNAFFPHNFKQMYFDVKGKKYKGLRLRFVLTVEERKVQKEEGRMQILTLKEKETFPVDMCSFSFDLANKKT